MSARKTAIRSSVTVGEESSLNSAALPSSPLARVVRFDYAFTPVCGAYQGARKLARWFENPDLLSEHFKTERELKVQVLCEFADSLAQVRSHLAESRLLLRNTSIPLPTYFARFDYEPEKTPATFFSWLFRNPVLEVNSFERKLDSFVKGYPDQTQMLVRTKLWIDSLREFIIHDYGHIADWNGGVVPKSEAAIKLVMKRRSALARKFDLSPLEIESLAAVESDLRAEVYRATACPSFREPQAWCRNMFYKMGDRKQREGFVSDRHGLISLALWSVSANQCGPHELPAELERIFVAPLAVHRLGDVVFYWALQRYLNDYFVAHRYDATWGTKLPPATTGPRREGLSGICRPF